jgi:hypothetical protein
MRKFILSAIFIPLILMAYSCKKEQKGQAGFSSSSASASVAELSTLNDFKHFPFDPSSSVLSRVKNMPEHLLVEFKKLDKKENYTNYAMTQEDKNLLSRYWDKLPPLIQKTMQKRLTAVFFIENFISSGYTEYLVAEDGSFYTYLILNPKVFKQSIQEWLTYKENTCFYEDQPGYKINIISQNEEKALLAILLHEGTHVVDYDRRITPYTDPNFKKQANIGEQGNSFTQEVWNKYKVPLEENDYRQREEISFYGIGGPNIEITDAVEVYEKNFATPFVSLYAAQNWAEDLAELVMFHHMVNVLGYSYRLEVNRGKKNLFQVEPMKNPRVIARLRHLAVFYQQ